MIIHFNQQTAIMVNDLVIVYHDKIPVLWVNSSWCLKYPFPGPKLGAILCPVFFIFYPESPHLLRFEMGN